MKVSEEIDGVHPCDLDVSDSQDLSARVCSGSTAFFFIQNTKSYTYSDDYDSAPAYDPVTGFDKLSQFGLNATDFATSAYNSQIECNCWEPVRDITQTLQFLQSDWKPANNYMSNVPVCDLDYLKSAGAWPGPVGSFAGHPSTTLVSFNLPKFIWQSITFRRNHSDGLSTKLVGQWKLMVPCSPTPKWRNRRLCPLVFLPLHKMFLEKFGDLLHIRHPNQRLRLGFFFLQE